MPVAPSVPQTQFLPSALAARRSDRVRDFPTDPCAQFLPLAGRSPHHGALRQAAARLDLHQLPRPESTHALLSDGSRSGAPLRRAGLELAAAFRLVRRRQPSALFLLGRKIASDVEALLACALMTVSYHHIWFSQNARGYMGLLFFTLLGTWLWLEAMDRDDFRLWASYAVCMALGFWIHMTILFVVAAHALIFAIVWL